MQWNEFSFQIRHFDAAGQRKVQQAFELGKLAHTGQMRQSGEPYFTHPIAVASMLIGMGADADTLAAALLHDTVEDTTVSLAQIQAEFGQSVAIMVDGVTKMSEQEIAEFPDTTQQIESLRKMFTLMQMDVRIMVIKLVDRLHNMQTISFRTPEKQKIIAKETLDVYVKIADRLCMRDLRDSLEELCRAVLEPELHSYIQEIRKKNEQRSVAEMAIMETKIKNKFGIPLYEKSFFERKTWEKLRLQYELEGASLLGISGINIVFICKTIDDCYTFLGHLHQLWRREVLTFEDFINAPVINGYKGLHTTILLEDGMRIRCKIRTTDMDMYAHKGVTLFCFDSKPLGIIDYLPWVGQISPLTEDPIRRSEKFWQSLQTDILGESIVVHGPSDESALVPCGATALDAVLYLFGPQGMRTDSILINGKPAQFYDEVTSANTITATFAAKPTVNIEWLQHTRTGIASAMIRQELVKIPQQDKEEIGRNLLQAAIKRVAGISMEELAPSVIRSQLRSLQATGLTDLFTQIAEGKLDADHVARSIFRNKQDASIRSEWTLTIQAKPSNDMRAERILRMFPFHKLTYKVLDNVAVLKAKYILTAKEIYQMQNALASVLKPEQWTMVQTVTYQRLVIAMLLLVVLWGLDPVFAQMLLTDTLNPFDLTLIRFSTFFIASSIAYLSQHYVFKQKLKPLSPLHPPLILSGIALFVTGMFTYIALSQISATQYILYIITGLALVNLLKNIIARKECIPQAISFALLIVGLIIMSYIQQTSIDGILPAIASSLGFALYSEVSRRYQKDVTTIQARYPAFMFWVSGICLLLSVGMLPFVDVHIPSAFNLLMTILFAIFFAVLPYVLFFETIRRTTSKFLDNSLPFVFVSTLLGEILLFGDYTAFLATPVLFIFLGLYLISKRQEA